jgi:hypothetical protein
VQNPAISTLKAYPKQHSQSFGCWSETNPLFGTNFEKRASGFNAGQIITGTTLKAGDD